MRLVLPAIPIVLAVFQARANDSDVQRALIEASCPAAKVKRLNPIGQSEVYEAQCFGRRITIVCVNGHCSADDTSHSRDDPK